MSDLTQIQTFMEVARARSFSAAAERLDLPRSTVAARVRALEARLGTRLLQRTTRVVTVTEDGERYLRACEQALSALGEVEDELRSQEGLSGLVRLSVPVDFPMDALTGLLTGFRRAHPGVRLWVDVSDEPVNLVEDRYDLALRGRDPGMPGLVARRIGIEALGLYEAPTALAQGAARPLLDPLEAAGETGSEPLPIATRSLALARQLALDGEVRAILPDALCARDVAAGRLRRVEPDAERYDMGVFLVFPSRQHLPARVRALIDFLAEALAKAR